MSLSRKGSSFSCSCFLEFITPCASPSKLAAMFRSLCVSFVFFTNTNKLADVDVPFCFTNPLFPYQFCLQICQSPNLCRIYSSRISLSLFIEKFDLFENPFREPSKISKFCKSIIPPYQFIVKTMVCFSFVKKFHFPDLRIFPQLFAQFGSLYPFLFDFSCPNQKMASPTIPCCLFS